MELVIPFTMPVIDTMSKAKEQHGEDAQFEFRAVSKTRGGMAIVDFRDFENKRFTENPSRILGYFKKGALQSVDMRVIGTDYWFTAFRRTGKKINMIDKALLQDLKVGTINQLWYNTELYSQGQYSRVNSKTWDSYAYRMNTPEPETV